jgi:hypothetical protein
VASPKSTTTTICVLKKDAASEEGLCAQELECAMAQKEADLIDERDVLVAAALRLFDKIWVATLFCTQKVDIQHTSTPTRLSILFVNKKRQTQGEKMSRYNF